MKNIYFEINKQRINYAVEGILILCDLFLNLQIVTHYISRQV